MELVPKDLGLRRYARTIFARAQTMYMSAGTAGSAELVRRADDLATEAVRDARSPGGNRRGNLYMHFLAHGLGLPPAVERCLTGPMGPILGSFIGGFGGGFGGGFLGPSIALFAIHHPMLGMFLGALGMGGVGVGVLAPRVILHQWATRPLGTAEIETLQQLAAKNPVELAYLDLLRDMLTYTASSEEAERRLREMVAVIGETIDSLPAAAATDADRVSLEAEATETQSRIEVESDPVVAQSLQRRLDAQQQALRSSERSTQQNRRAAALREELIAQMRALRLSLTEGGEVRGSLTALAGLAESLRTVTVEADSVAQARAELDAATEASAWHTVTPTPTEVATEQKVVRVGSRG